MQKKTRLLPRPEATSSVRYYWAEIIFNQNNSAHKRRADELALAHIYRLVTWKFESLQRQISIDDSKMRQNSYWDGWMAVVMGTTNPMVPYPAGYMDINGI